MKWIIPVLIFAVGVVALALFPPPATADGCAIRSRAVVVHTPATVVVKKEVAVTAVATVATVLPVAVFQPIAVAVPTYTASYVPAPYTPTPAPAPGFGPAESKAMLEALQGISRRLDALERRAGGGGVAPVPAGPTGSASPVLPAERKGGLPAVFSAKCAACHTRGKEGDGGGFVLLEPDGSASKLDARAVLAVVRRSYAGTMPPKSSKLPPLTDQEVGEIIAWSEASK